MGTNEEIKVSEYTYRMLDHLRMKPHKIYSFDGILKLLISNYFRVEAEEECYDVENIAK